MNEPPISQLLIYQTEDGRIKLDVRFEGETVWLTQQHMAELFGTTQQSISLHLQNIFSEGELTVAATHKEFLSVRDGGVLGDASLAKEFFSTDGITNSKLNPAKKATRL